MNVCEMQRLFIMRPRVAKKPSNISEASVCCFSATRAHKLPAELILGEVSLEVRRLIMKLKKATFERGKW